MNDDNIHYDDNFTDELRIETREFVRPDGSIIKVKAPKWRLDAMEAAEKAKQETEVLPDPIAEHESVDTDVTTTTASTELPSIEQLTVEIKMYLHIANQSIIEVGKRLILAKKMLPHGNWANWLKNNFNLGQSMADKMMKVATRFSNSESIPNFDISTFKPTQLIALLALPVGDEEKFIAEKAAEGTPVEDMTVKTLREEVKQWKEKFALAQSRSDGMFQSNGILQDELRKTHMKLDSEKARADKLAAELTHQKTVVVPPADYESLKQENEELRNRPIDVAIELPADYESTKKEIAELKARELSFKQNYTVRQTLNHLFSLLPTLINADNLKSVVDTYADEDREKLEHQLSQLLSLHDTILNHLIDS